VGYWDLVDNPTGESYISLIDLLCAHSDTFYFVTRKELDYDVKIIQQFQPYIIEQYKTKEWASTRTSGPAATVYKIEVCSQTCQLLKKLANSLYDWISPGLPEDLTFIKNNFVWFVSCSHEEFAYFNIRSTYYENIITESTKLNIIKID